MIAFWPSKYGWPQGLLSRLGVGMLACLALNAAAYLAIVKPQFSEISRLQTVYGKARLSGDDDKINRLEYVSEARRDVKVFFEQLAPVASIVNHVKELTGMIYHRKLSVTRMVTHGS